MKFIFNFIFFGLLFYVISFYFPEAFATLVSWVSGLYLFIHNSVLMILEQLNLYTGHSKEPVEEIQGLLPLLFWYK